MLRSNPSANYCRNIARRIMWCRAVFAVTLLLIAFVTDAQVVLPQTQITGFVRDSVTREPVAKATISLVNTGEGVIAEDNGGFIVDTYAKFHTIRVSAVGYRTKEISVKYGESAVCVVDLVPAGTVLDEVVVKRTKEHYSKKNNPAVDFVKSLRAIKRAADPASTHSQYNYEKYERMTYGIIVSREQFAKEKGPLLERFPSLANYVDTLSATGINVLPVSINEKVSEEMFDDYGKRHREFVIGQTHAGFDESFDVSSLKKFQDEIMGEIDIFTDNDLTFMTNRFVSPLSRIAVDFYKYYLTDTVSIDGKPYIELSFAPFNTQSFGFIGRLYVAQNDSTMFVKRIKMNVPHNINLNYVKNVYIEQVFERADDGSRLKTLDKMVVEFQVLKGSQSLYAERSTTCRQHGFDKPNHVEAFANANEYVVSELAEVRTEDFWNSHRDQAFKTSDKTIREMMKAIRSSKLFYWTEQVLVTFIRGYIHTDERKSRWDFGPINSTISANELEGLRLRVGGMTTAHFNKHWFAKTYLAYGFKDEKLKYMGMLEYSFNEKLYHSNEFPIHSIKLTHEYDVDKVGQHYLYTANDNMFLLLRRHRDDKLIYLRKTELEYKQEHANGFSWALTLMHNVHESSRLLPFVDGLNMAHKNYVTAGFKLNLRYAPGEKFFQTVSYRIPINIDKPIFTLSHTYLPRGFLGGEFDINKTELGVMKRFWFSAFGYTDVILKAAKLWNNAPFPDLLEPNGNLSYTIQDESFTLMRPMEFVADQYASWDVTYWANGWILNRIPLLNKLKLREVFSCRGIFGSIRDMNLPKNNQRLYRFPETAVCQSFDKKPYVEVGVGIDNIFTLLRIDYVWRINYRHTPQADRSGIRIQIHTTF